MNRRSTSSPFMLFVHGRLNALSELVTRPDNAHARVDVRRVRLLGLISLIAGDDFEGV